MWDGLGIGGLGISGGAWWFGIQGEGCACQGRCNTGLSLRLLEDMSFEVWLNVFLIIVVDLMNLTKMNAISLMRTPKFISKYSFVVDKIHMGNFPKNIRATVH